MQHVPDHVHVRDQHLESCGQLLRRGGAPQRRRNCFKTFNGNGLVNCGGAAAGIGIMASSWAKKSVPKHWIKQRDDDEGMLEQAVKTRPLTQFVS